MEGFKKIHAYIPLDELIEPIFHDYGTNSLLLDMYTIYV